MKYAIQDVSYESPCYIKFITPAHPLGLLSGKFSARTFNTLEEAEKYLEKLRQAIVEDAWERAGETLKGPLEGSYKITRFLSIINDAGLDLECYKIVPPPHVRGSTMHFINCYHVRDRHGNVAYALADDTYDDIMVSVKDAKGFNLTYDGEARHLNTWCKDWGLEYRHQILELEIQNPFDLE